MNVKRAERIYLAIIIVCLAIISTSVYYVLGGFNKLEIYEFDGTNRTVIGKHYIGRLPPGNVRDFLMESKTLIDSGKLQGRLTLVEYQNDTIGLDSIHLFIGASFDEIRNVLEIPSGYTYEEYGTNKIYRVFITQHPLVSPSPVQVREMIANHANQYNEELHPYSFDIYYPDGSRFTEGWVR